MCASALHTTSYWTPVEKLILHLSPVTRRKTIKPLSSGQHLGFQKASKKAARDRRTRSEPSHQHLIDLEIKPRNVDKTLRNLSRKNVRSSVTSSSSNSLSSPSSENSGSDSSDSPPGFMNEIQTMKLHVINKVETELIDKLDILISENKGDQDYKNLFNEILKEKIKANDPIWRKNGIHFVESVTQLLERLLDYRSVVQGDGDQVINGLDQKMSCTVNLLNFYGSSNESRHRRQEMCLRYVYKLHDLHTLGNNPNFTEAGFTLKLHADLLQWSNRTLHSDLRYPTQKEWQRKEELYLKIIYYLEKGKQWEHAIPLCKELAEVYEQKVFEYDKLADILKRQASLFEKINSNAEENLRLDPEYFRVGFYGKGFPMFLRNKEFIYRGLDWEKISTFSQRISTEFPSSQLLSSNTPPDERTRESDAQFVQICCVKPVPNDAKSLKQRFAMEGYQVPEKISSFYNTNDVQSFQYDRPFHKGHRDKDNEFKTLWVERSTYTTTSPFPGILKWFGVEKVYTDEIAPIDHACEVVGNKIVELRRLIANEPENGGVLKLTQALQGVIDAAVNGGIAKYADAFFTQTYLEDDANDVRKVQQLHNLLSEQLNVLELGLRVHEKVVSSDIRPLHEHLKERFTQLRKYLPQQLKISISNQTTPTKGLPRGNSIVNTPLPPVPKGGSEDPNYSSHLNYYSWLGDDSGRYSKLSAGERHSNSSGWSNQEDPDLGRTIPIAVEETVYCQPSQKFNMMTTSCPSANLASALHRNSNISTPSRYSSQKTLNNQDGLVYGNHSTVALSVNVAKCSNTSSVMSSSPSSTGSSTELIPPPRPPTASSSLLRKKQAPLPHHHHHYHHHQRDSGHASIGSSEDVSVPPLPPRYSTSSNSSLFATGAITSCKMAMSPHHTVGKSTFYSEPGPRQSNLGNVLKSENNNENEALPPIPPPPLPSSLKDNVCGKSFTPPPIPPKTNSSPMSRKVSKVKCKEVEEVTNDGTLQSPKAAEESEKDEDDVLFIDDTSSCHLMSPSSEG